MKRRGPGRPKMPRGEARDTVFVVRLTRGERASVDAAALAAGVKASEWARSALLEALPPGREIARGWGCAQVD